MLGRELAEKVHVKIKTTTTATIAQTTNGFVFFSCGENHVEHRKKDQSKREDIIKKDASRRRNLWQTANKRKETTKNSLFPNEKIVLIAQGEGVKAFIPKGI